MEAIVQGRRTKFQIDILRIVGVLGESDINPLLAISSISAIKLLVQFK